MIQVNLEYIEKYCNFLSYRPTQAITKIIQYHNWGIIGEQIHRLKPAIIFLNYTIIVATKTRLPRKKCGNGVPPLSAQLHHLLMSSDLRTLLRCRSETKYSHKLGTLTYYVILRNLGILKSNFANYLTSTNCWREMFNNNLKRNHAKHEKWNTAIKQTSADILSAAALRPSIIYVVAHEFSATRSG